MSMLKATRTTKQPKNAARPKSKKPTPIPPENLRAIALLEEWKQRPMSDAEIQAWEETMKSLDESRPHRPLFS